MLVRHAKSRAGTCSFALIPRLFIFVSVFVHYEALLEVVDHTASLLATASAAYWNFAVIMPPPTDYAEEKAKSLRGELYTSFNPQLLAERLRCSRACDRYNAAGEVSRRRLVEMWRE